MPRIVLTRAMTHMHATHYGRVHKFRRGVITEVDENTYNLLMRKGGFADPDQRIDLVHPKILKGVPPGSKVPIFRDIGLGDVLIVSIPVWELQRRYPKLRIIYGVHSKMAPLFNDTNGIHAVKPIGDVRGTFRYGMDLRGYAERSMRSRGIDRVDLYCNYLLGGPPSSYEYPLKPQPGWAEKGREISGAGDGRPTVGLVLKASMSNRSWNNDYLERFTRLALAGGWRVVLLHNRPTVPGWLDHPFVVNLTTKLDVEELKWVVSAMDAVVSPDTGTLHLSEALRRPTVAIMTTVPPELRLSHYTHTRAVYPAGKLKCLGCIHTPRCGVADNQMKPCARASTPELVWDQVEFMHENDPPYQVYSWLGTRPTNELRRAG